MVLDIKIDLVRMGVDWNGSRSYSMTEVAIIGV
jgi:hypothetical protein